MSILVILILIVSGLGLILAHLGHFTLITLCIPAGSLFAIALLLGRTKLRLSLPRGIELFSLLALAAIAAVLFFRPHQYLDGGWDPGSYVNTGVHISRTGSVSYHDDVLARSAAQDRRLLSSLIRSDGTGIKYPGLYIKDAGKGWVVPQFFHLYPVWLAIFHKLGGLEAPFYVNPFFSLCSVLLVFLIGRRLGKRYAFLAALLLAVNVIQGWSARFSIPEVLGQFLLLSGLYFWTRYLDSRDRFFAFWSGLAMGEFLLVSVTSLLILPIVIAYLVFRARKEDIYFILPFALTVVYLVIQVCTVSSPYLDSVTMFFRHREMYLGGGMLLLLLCCVPLVKRLPSVYVRVSLAAVIVGAFAYGYAVRPRLFSSFEARNLVELGEFLSPFGLVLAVAGLVWMICKERREDVLFFAVTGLIVAAFFIYDKRMYSRYPFALKRYVPVVLPVYCFSISYLCSRLKFKAGWAVSIVAVCVVATLPLARCRDMVLVRDHYGAVSFWTEFARRLDDDAVYITSHYRWARPLADIFGKQSLAFAGAREFDGERVAEFARRLIAEGRNVYYVSELPGPWSLGVDFVEVYRQSLRTEYLEHSMTFPPVARAMDLPLTIFEVVPIEESRMLTTDEYTIDVGAETMGLLGGFDRARRFSGIPEYARWTLREAQLVIPWFGDSEAQTLTMLASGMPERAGSTRVSLYVEDFPVIEDHLVGPELKEHAFFIPAGTARTGGKKRAVLTIRSNTWDPAEQGIRGYPRELGIRVYWVKLSRTRP